MLEAGDNVGSVSMTRSVENRVICHEQRFYPHSVAARIEPERFVEEDASAVLEDVLGRRRSSARTWESEIAHAPAHVAGPLGIASRGLVLANSYTWLIEGGGGASRRVRHHLLPDRQV